MISEPAKLPKEMSRALKKRRFLTIVLSLLALGGVIAGTVVSLNQDSGPVYSSVEVKNQTLEVSVAANGQLVDEISYGLAAGIDPQVVATATGSLIQGASLQSAPGFIVTEVLVRPGEKVTKDQELIVLENPLGQSQSLLSPTDGIIRDLRAVVGASASGQLVTLGTGRLLSIVQVSEYDIASISNDQQAVINIDALGQEFSATVFQIGQQADSSTGVKRYSVLLELANLPETARLGMSTNAKIITQSISNTLSIPANAIANIDGKNVVAVIDDEQNITATEVQIGVVGDTLVQITSGLTAGQKVVVGQIGEIPEVNQDFGPPPGVRSN
jgi:multidrug efflux pump subunit AcrA (membrane-fusion protein)